VLGGVQVLFDGVPAALLYAGATQIKCHRSSRNRRALGKQYQCDHPTGRITGPTLPVVSTLPQVFSYTTGFAMAVNENGSLTAFQIPLRQAPWWRSGLLVAALTPIRPTIRSMHR